MKPRSILFAGLIVIVCGALPAVADVPISTTQTDARQVVLDHDPDTGNYFAVVRGSGPTIYDSWGALYISTDHGTNWNEAWSITRGSLVFDVDMVVAGGYVYVGHGQAAIVRFSATDGSFDGVYGFRAVLDVSPAEVVDVALASNQDGADSELYYAFILDNGTLSVLVADSSDGTMFLEMPLGISDAYGGPDCLDMTFNSNSTDYDIIISYLSTDSTVHVRRHQISGSWQEVNNVGYFGFDARTAISASDDNVVLAWQTNFFYGASIIAYTSDDAGDTWDVVGLDTPQFSGDGPFSMVDVTARGSQGFAAVYHQGLVGFDPVFIRRGIDFYPASWEPRVSINQFDASTSRPVNVNWFPPHHYGIAYVGDDGIAYFDLVDASLFSDGFESGATSAWSATVP